MQGIPKDNTSYLGSCYPNTNSVGGTDLYPGQYVLLGSFQRATRSRLSIPRTMCPSGVKQSSIVIWFGCPRTTRPTWGPNLYHSGVESTTQLHLDDKDLESKGRAVWLTDCKTVKGCRVLNSNHTLYSQNSVVSHNTAAVLHGMLALFCV
jgi:hypothetical protein